jgi:hypothetical protein
LLTEAFKTFGKHDAVNLVLCIAMLGPDVDLAIGVLHDARQTIKLLCEWRIRAAGCIVELLLAKRVGVGADARVDPGSNAALIRLPADLNRRELQGCGVGRACRRWRTLGPGKPANTGGEKWRNSH